MAQAQRENAITKVAEDFCAAQVPLFEPESARGRFLGSEGECAFVLRALHDQPTKDWVLRPIAKEIVERFTDLDVVEMKQAIVALYEQFALHAPNSLDAFLVYDPKFPNPVRMVTSALAHADIWHLAGNLIFFFAFAGSIEIALGSRRHYVGILLVLAAITALAYSLAMFTSSYRTPSFGLSGIVMGMIGLFAYLMPWARIRTFIWVFFYVNIILIPAWVLAVWFIGMDIWNVLRLDSRSEIDYSAHISGGIGGYLLGRYWFGKRKEEITPLVDDEVEHRRAERADVLGMLDSARVGTDRMDIQRWHASQALELDRLLERVYGLATTGQSSLAIAKLIEELPSLGDTLEFQAAVMERMYLWPPNRTTLDFARIHTHRLISLDKKHEALEACEKALEQSALFRLADPVQAVVLAEFADSSGRQDLALALIRGYEARYEGQGDLVRAGLLEARMLWEYELDRDAARSRLVPLLSIREHVLHPKVIRLAKMLAL